MPDRQLPLAFPPRPALGAADFLPHDGVRYACELLAKGAWGPQRRVVVWGGSGAGKTHLLQCWASDNGATFLRGPALVEPFWPDGPLAIDDVDQGPSEPTLLYILNAAAEGGRAVLLSSTRSPARTAAALPDLASRLRGSLAAEIGPPDDEGLAILLTKLLSDRQLAVAPALQRWLLTRLPRTVGTLREAAARLDYAALAAQTGVSRTLATQCLSDLLVNEPV